MRSASIEARLRVRERPASPAVMRQNWRSLLFLHWACDAKTLQDTLPPELFVDLYQGEAFIGVTPFFMRNVRPRFCPSIPGFSNFLELNVRTYVVNASGIPGVWFYSLTCNNGLAALLARRLYFLPYRTARMKAEVRSAEYGPSIDYQILAEGEPAEFRYAPAGPGRPVEPGSLEFFFVERYVLFAQHPGSRRVYSARVHHAPYLLCDPDVTAWSRAPLQDAGVSPLSAELVHKAYSPGVDVEVFAPEADAGPGSGLG